jgi:hypothetical protein
VGEIMPGINFQKQFAEAVRSGKKSQTIRAIWTNPEMQRNLFVPGATVYLWTGMRSKSRVKLGEAVIDNILPVTINHSTAQIHFPNGLISVMIAGEMSIEHFAQEDGFKGWNEMCDWFDKTHGLPFMGLLIHWTDFKKE